MRDDGYKGDNTVERRKEDASRLLAIEEGHHRLDVRECDVEERMGRELCERRRGSEAAFPSDEKKATHELVLRIPYDELWLGCDPGERARVDLAHPQLRRIV